eukprot:29024-Pelagococcus_subviridis.AAC.10
MQARVQERVQALERRLAQVDDAHEVFQDLRLRDQRRERVRERRRHERRVGVRGGGQRLRGGASEVRSIRANVGVELKGRGVGGETRDTPEKVLKDRRPPRERGRMGTSVRQNAPDADVLVRQRGVRTDDARREARRDERAQHRVLPLRDRAREVLDRGDRGDARRRVGVKRGVETRRQLREQPRRAPRGKPAEALRGDVPDALLVAAGVLEEDVEDLVELRVG